MACIDRQREINMKSIEEKIEKRDFFKRKQKQNKIDDAVKNMYVS